MKKTIKWILITLFFLLVVIILAGMYKFNYLASQEGYDVDGNPKLPTSSVKNNISQKPIHKSLTP